MPQSMSKIHRVEDKFPNLKGFLSLHLQQSSSKSVNFIVYFEWNTIVLEFK